MNHLYLLRAETEESSNMDLFVWAPNPHASISHWASYYQDWLDEDQHWDAAWAEYGIRRHKILDGSLLIVNPDPGPVGWETFGLDFDRINEGEPA